jgi:2'-5' RNA ligase
LRWVPEGHHHITLCYLGDTPRAEIPHLVKDVEAVRAALHPFVMTFQEVARFPQTQRSKVIAAMVEESEPLEALHQQLDTLLVQRGYPPDKHSHFVPHMTLLHDDGTQAYAPHTLKAFRVNVDRFVLYESKGAGEYLPLVPFTL